MGLAAIQSAFRFLIDEYGMSEREVYESGMGSYVIYESEACRVTVAVDRGILSVELSTNERYIIERRKITLSEILRRAGVVYPPSGASGRLGGDMTADIVAQTATAAAVLRAHGDPYLHGDFG